mmetsp:Transcript_135551/g.433632  ORF Transcript_135551/g.433632 Transcript_135551/m.433632 type:complete len:130 (-) Transcript_135551:81-470(-)
MVWDVRNLSDPKLVGNFYSTEVSIDHNLYVDGRVLFESNYCAGLRILEIVEGTPPTLKEIGFFDVNPECKEVRFRGTWSNYPWFQSGIVVVTDMTRGVFLLRPKLTGRWDLGESRRQAHIKRVAKGMSN